MGCLLLLCYIKFIFLSNKVFVYTHTRSSSSVLRKVFFFRCFQKKLIPMLLALCQRIVQFINPINKMYHLYDCSYTCCIFLRRDVKSFAIDIFELHDVCRFVLSSLFTQQKLAVHYYHRTHKQQQLPTFKFIQF